MRHKYYIDTTIWIDLLKCRNYKKNNYCNIVFTLFSLIKAKKATIIISDLIVLELASYFTLNEINTIMSSFQGTLKNVIATKKQIKEANNISAQRNIPPADVLHAILARDHNLVLITNDKDFKELEDICNNYKPEDLI